MNSSRPSTPVQEKEAVPVTEDTERAEAEAAEAAKKASQEATDKVTASLASSTLNETSAPASTEEADKEKEVLVEPTTAAEPPQPKTVEPIAAVDEKDEEEVAEILAGKALEKEIKPEVPVSLSSNLHSTFGGGRKTPPVPAEEPAPAVQQGPGM